MPLISVIITLVVVGVVLWLINLIPMQPTIKKIVNAVIVIFAVLWLFRVFGFWQYLANITI